MLCKDCGERPVSPSCLARHDYRCSRCRHSTPAGIARNRRYFRSDKKRACNRLSNAKRIFVGAAYHSMAHSAETARAIQAHIKERRRGFIARQSNREEAESPTAC